MYQVWQNDHSKLLCFKNKLQKNVYDFFKCVREMGEMEFLLKLNKSFLKRNYVEEIKMTVYR